MPPDLAVYVRAHGCRRELQIVDVQCIAAGDSLYDCPRFRPGQVDLTQFLSAVGELDLFADDVVIKVLNHFLGHAGSDIELVGIPAVGQSHTINQEVRDDPRLGRGQKGLAAMVNLKVFDVVCAEVLQEDGGVRAGDFHLAALGHIEQDSVVVGLCVFGNEVRHG
jgi:hypothetical protein